MKNIGNDPTKLPEKNNETEKQSNLEKERELTKELFHHIESKSKNRLDVNLVEIENRWMDSLFTKKCINNKKGVSENDLLFLNYCLAYYCKKQLQHPNENFITMRTRLQIMLLQRFIHPTAEEIQKTFESCVYYIAHPRENDIIDQIINPEIEIKLKLLKLLPKDESQIQEEDLGNMGKIYSIDYTKDLLQMTNRCFSKIRFEYKIFNKYKLLEPIKIEESHITNTKNWFIERSQTFLPDEFRIAWQKLAYNDLLPLNALAQTLKSAITVDTEISTPGYLLSEEAGENTTSAFNEIFDAQQKDIAKNPEHMCYEFYLLGELTNILNSKYRIGEVDVAEAEVRKKVGFIKVFYVDNALLHKQYKRFDEIKTNYKADRRPLITRFFKKWYIHDRTNLIPCKDFIHCWLTWCILMKTNYNSELDDGVCINNFLNLFV
jgi:hypothetical protein